MKAVKTKTGDRLFGLRINLLVKNENPFVNVIGSVLMNLKLEVSDKIPTACINIKNKTIYFGSEFIESLSDKKLRGLLMHEVMHYLLVHDFHLTLDKVAFALMNLAQDIKINHYLLKIGESLPEDGVLPDIYKDSFVIPDTNIVVEKISEKSSEDIYKELLEIVNKMDNETLKSLIEASDVVFIDGEPDGDNGKAETIIDSLANIQEGVLNEATSIVKNSIEKAAGKETLSKEIDMKLIPETILRLLGWYKTFFSKMKNKLTNRVHKIIKQKISYPKKRLYEKGIYVNKTINKGYFVNIFVDTSGSMSEEDIKECTRHIFPVCKYGTIRLRCFDTKLYDEVIIKNYKDIDKIKVKGRGGTDINKVLEECKNKAIKQKCINILYTDLYDDIDSTNTIYVDMVIVTKNHDENNVGLFKNVFNYES